MQGYVVDQEMQEAVVVPQAAVSAAAETTEAPLPESPWNVEAVPRPDFEAAPAYNGPRPGYAFKTGPQGLGYYVDLTRDEQFTPVVPVPMERGQGTARHTSKVVSRPILSEGSGAGAR